VHDFTAGKARNAQKIHMPGMRVYGVGQRTYRSALVMLATMSVVLSTAVPADAKKVPPVPTSIALQASASNAAYGQEQSVVFSATVTASNGEKPSGKGSVLDGKKKLCALIITNGAGSCSPKATALKNGSYSLTASFTKSTKFLGSTSISVSFVVGSPPTTTITSAPSGKVPSGPVEITFTSNEPLASFQCSLDGAPYIGCMSPDQVNVGPGTHEFKVRAVSADGIIDASPATASWTSVGPAPTLELCGEITHSETLSTATAAVFVISCPLTIERGATLTIEPSTIIKTTRSGELRAFGSLVVDGTSGSPVTFTSFYDDTVGGDTDGDGGAEAPRRGDWSGIQVLEGGQVNAQYAVVDYASTGFDSTDAASVVVSHSTVENASNDGFEAYTTGEGTEAAKTVELTSNLVKGVNSGGIYVRAEGSGAAVTVPVVESNTVDEAGSDAVDIEGEALDPSKLTGNSGSADSVPALSLGGKVAHNLTLPLGGLPLVLDGGPGLTIDAGVTMTVPAGTVIKAKRYAEFSVYGSLVVDGTSGSPVTFTSFYDDTVGGDTDGDGGAEAPRRGDWSGIMLEEAGTASLEETIIKYASTGLSASGKSSASVRARFESDSSDVDACAWGQECSVDADYSYWGSSQGPYPAGKEGLACGAVTASPYRTNPSGTKTASGASAFNTRCSGETVDEGLASAQSSAAQWENSEQIDCGEGYKEACEVIEKYEQCLGAASTLAQESSPFTFSNGLESIGSDAASWLESSAKAVARAIGSVASFGLQLIGAATTIIDIAKAYDSCT
jgi:Bacterial Ig-like domain (group 3)